MFGNAEYPFQVLTFDEPIEKKTFQNVKLASYPVLHLQLFQRLNKKLIYSFKNLFQRIIF